MSFFSKRSYGVGGKGFFGIRPEPAAKPPPTFVNIITFNSGTVLAPTYDFAGPGIAPPAVTLVPAHPAAEDFTMGSGGTLIAGNVNNLLYSVLVLPLGEALLSLNVVGGTFQQTDIQTVSFVGADGVTYNLTTSDFFTIETDIGDPTLIYSRWEWFGEIGSNAFEVGVDTTLTIVANFDFGNSP